MKKMYLIILAVFTFSGISFTQPNDIDYNPKSLNKEIRKLFNVSDYRTKEIEVHGSIWSREFICGKFYNLSDSFSEVGYLYIGRVFSCSANGCKASDLIDPGATSEYFDYYILYDTLKKIAGITVYRYEATHGQEVTAKGWLSQFTGYDGKNDLVIGMNVDAITGATKSVNSLMNDVRKVTKILNLTLK